MENNEGKYWPTAEQFYKDTGHNRDVWQKIGPATLFSPGTYLLTMTPGSKLEKGSVTRIVFDGSKWLVMDKFGKMLEVLWVMSNECLFMYFDQTAEDEDLNDQQ